MKKGLINDRTAKLVLFLLVFGITAAYGIVLNIPPVLDEVGTMANAAFLNGYDWRRCVVSMGSFYYKYGTVILYAPVFALLKSSYLIYKVIMLMHAVMAGFIPVISYVILRKHLKIDSSRICFAISAVTGILPSVILYSLYARADAILIFIAWPICLSLLEAWKAGQDNNSRRQIVFSILAGALSVYAYMSHSRGVVYIIAVFLTIILFQLITHRKIVRYIPYLSVTAVLMAADKLLSRYFIAHVYGTYGPKHANANTFSFETLGKIFTKDGVTSMLKMVFGWLYNVFASTYGMAIIGILASAGLIYVFNKNNRMKRKKQDVPAETAHDNQEKETPAVSPEEAIIATFGLLSFLGTFAMGCLFFFPVIYDFCTGAEIERPDRFLYGRYTVSSVGILLLVALYLFYVKRKFIGIKTKIFSILAYIAVLVIFMLITVPHLSEKSMNLRYLISLNTFLKLSSYGKTVDLIPQETISTALLLAGILALIIFTVLILLSLKNKKTNFIISFGIMIVFSIVILNINYFKIRYSRDAVLVERSKDVTSLLEQTRDVDDEYLKILCNNNRLNIKHYQFVCKEYFIGTQGTKALHEENTFVIDKTYPKEDGYPYYLFECFDYDAVKSKKDIVYVRGDGLKNELERLGYKMIRYDNTYDNSISNIDSDIDEDTDL